MKPPIYTDESYRWALCNSTELPNRQTYSKYFSVYITLYQSKSDLSPAIPQCSAISVCEVLLYSENFRLVYIYSSYSPSLTQLPHNGTAKSFRFIYQEKDLLSMLCLFQHHTARHSLHKLTFTFKQSSIVALQRKNSVLSGVLNGISQMVQAFVQKFFFLSWVISHLSYRRLQTGQDI